MYVMVVHNTSPCLINSGQKTRHFSVSVDIRCFSIIIDRLNTYDVCTCKCIVIKYVLLIDYLVGYFVCYKKTMIIIKGEWNTILLQYTL